VPSGTDRLDVEVAVVGGGPAGLTAAIALAGGGVDTALVSRAPRPDNRTTFLLAGSVAALETLGVWEICRQHGAPLTGIRLVDDTSRLLRAPEVLFRCDEIGLAAFGANIENRHLLAALDARAAALATLRRIDEAAIAIDIGAQSVTVRLTSGRDIRARLVVGADGRNSMCRASAGIATDSRSYPQAALTLNLAHTRPHRGVSTEFHTSGGPFTLVPLPGARSSLVCVVAPDEAERLAGLEPAKLSAEIERRAHSMLGTMSVEGERGLFRLGLETARRCATDRIVLIGEAAHVIPPIGAQGLNLGLRDAATIAELVIAARRGGEDVGSAGLLARYEGARRADVTSRSIAVDLLNRSLLSDFLPAQAVRGLGLHLVGRVGPLRRAVMRAGVAPVAGEPRLMRGELP
jgi:2-octaprenyl-6-methoxyphenol hydroxylase